MESGEVIGGIFIPDSAMKRNSTGAIATVVAENPRQNDPSGFVGRKVIVGMWGGVEFTWKGQRIRKLPLSVDNIMAVLHDGEWIPLKNESGKVLVKGEDRAIVRCRFCRSEGQGNMICDADGVCPKCGKTSTGRKHEPKPVSVSEDEKEELGAPSPKIAKGTKFSYAGQAKRS
jgi:co-chaperonin GroES (HSP10)